MLNVTSGIVIDLAPDIDLIGDQDRQADRESFHDNHAEILLMRRENECVSTGKSASLQIAIQHSCENNLIGKTTACSALAQLLSPPDLVRSCQDKKETGTFFGSFRHCFDQHVTPFLRMQSTQKQENIGIPKLRITGNELLARAGGHTGRRGQSKRRNFFAATIQPKR